MLPLTPANNYTATVLFCGGTNLQPDQWTHVKIDVHGRQARLYINNSPNPSLVISGLKGESLDGAVGLWGYARQESYFSNLKITTAPPEPITNDGEIAGTWTVNCLGDAGSFAGTMKLVREGSTIAGLWSSQSPARGATATSSSPSAGHGHSFPAPSPQPSPVGSTKTPAPDA